MAETFAQASSAPSPSASTPVGFPPKKRIDCSLNLLAQRFMKLLWLSVDGSLDLGMAARTLSAPRRRLYDITNVLQGIGLIKRTSASKIKLLGNEDSVFARLTAEEQELDEQIQTCTLEIFQLRMDQTNWRFAYLTHEDLQSIPSLKEETVLMIKAPVDTTLEVPNPEESLQVHLRSTKGPIQVFLSSDDPTPVRTTGASPACGFNGTLPNRKDSHVSSPRTSTVQVSSKDGDNDISRRSRVSNAPFELSQHSSLVTVAPITAPPSLHSPLKEEQSFVTLTPPVGLSEGEAHSPGVGEDEGITNLFPGDVDGLDLDVPMT